MRHELESCKKFWIIGQTLDKTVHSYQQFFSNLEIARLFALNTGLKFYTPEQYFLGRKNEEEHVMPAFDPKTVFSKTGPPLLEPPTGQAALSSISSLVKDYLI